MKKFNYSDLLSAKHKFGGKSIKEGFDCWTLLQEIYKRLGDELPDYESVVTSVEVDRIFNRNVEAFKRLDNPQPYAIVAFHTEPDVVGHIGMVLEDSQRFIHCLEGSNVCVERLTHPYWFRKIEGFYIWKNSKL